VKVWPGNHVVSPEEEKERLQWKGFAEKGFKFGMTERVGDEKLIIISVAVRGINERKKTKQKGERICAGLCRAFLVDVAVVRLLFPCCISKIVAKLRLRIVTNGCPLVVDRFSFMFNSCDFSH